MKKVASPERYELLKVVEVEPERVSKKGATYKLVTFESIILEGKKETKTGLRATRPFWKERKEPQINFQTGESRIHVLKGDATYECVRVGDYYMGKIKEFRTTLHKRDGRSENTFRCVIYENEYGKELDVATKQLKYFRARPLDENGNMYKPAQTNGTAWVKDDGQFDDGYEMTAEDYEDDALEFLSGGDIQPEDFDGEWDGLYTSKGLE